MAELSATEAGVSPNFTSKQLSNVIWKHCGIEVPSFVGLGVSKYSRQVSEYTDTAPDTPPPDSPRYMYQPAPQLSPWLPSVVPPGLNPVRQKSPNFPSPTKLPPLDEAAALPRPVLTRAGTSTAIHGTEVYFSVSSHGYDCPSPNLDRQVRFRMPHYVWRYNIADEECSVVEHCLAVHDFGLAVVNEELVIVGGETDQRKVYPNSPSPLPITACSSWVPEKISSDIAVLDLNRDHFGWQYGYFPPMSKPRKYPAALCVEQYLVVAGGEGDDHELLGFVEVLNTESEVWSQVTSLPEPVRSLATALCGNQLYFLGCFNNNGSSHSVFTCPVESIKEACPSSRKKIEWQKACDTPLFRSSCVVYNDELFAVGGRTSPY